MLFVWEKSSTTFSIGSVALFYRKYAAHKQPENAELVIYKIQIIAF